MSAQQQSARGGDALFDTLGVAPEQAGVVRQLAAIQGVTPREYVMSALAQRVAADSGLNIEANHPRSMLASVAMASARYDENHSDRLEPGAQLGQGRGSDSVTPYQAEVERCASIAEAYALGHPKFATHFSAIAAHIRAGTPMADVEKRLFASYVDPYAALNEPGLSSDRPPH